MPTANSMSICHMSKCHCSISNLLKTLVISFKFLTDGDAKNVTFVSFGIFYLESDVKTN